MSRGSPRAKPLASGDDFAVANVARVAALNGAQSATYVASVRAGGETNGKAIGFLAIHFDWEPQARTIVEGVRLAPAERAHSRVMLLDAENRVIACSKGNGLLTSAIPSARRDGAREATSTQRGASSPSTRPRATRRIADWDGAA